MPSPKVWFQDQLDYILDDFGAGRISRAAAKERIRKFTQDDDQIEEWLEGAE